MKAATVDKNSKAHLSPGKKPKPKEQVVVPLSGVEEISVQTKKSENSTDRAGSANPESNRMGLNNIMASAHSSQTIHGKGSEIMYDKLQESLSVTGDINHPDTKKLKKLYDDPKPQSGTGLS